MRFGCSSASLLRLLVLVTCCVCQLASSAPSDILEKVKLSNTDAICNDFSRAIYYRPPNLGPSNENWVIFFEGGGGCTSFEECNQLWQRFGGQNNPLMSSEPYPAIVEGRDLLSSDNRENPLFHNYTHILVPYCTQDAFLANRSNPNVPNPDITYRVNSTTFNQTADADNFVFKGKVVFESVIEELVENYGLAGASKVVLAGSSAGGIGVLNNLEWVEAALLVDTSLSLGPELAVIVDSSWFITFNQNHAVDFDMEIARGFNLPPACSDFTLGSACCASPSCLFTRGYMTSDVPIFAVSSTHDILTLEDPLKDSLDSSEGPQDDRDLLRIFNSYGSLMNESFVQSYSAYPNLTIFAPSCTQHVYLANSDLWKAMKGLLAKTITENVSEPPFLLRNPVRYGNWKLVEVESHEPPQNITLLDALMEWYFDLSTRRFYADQCLGPACGNNCTSSIDLAPEFGLWPTEINILILVFAALLTAIPSIIKLGLYLHMKYILFRQRLYAFNLKHSPKSFPKATHPINVSCVNLYYRIDTVNKAKAKTEDSDIGVYTEDQYDLYAGIETFLPCCKKMFSGCVTRYKPPVHDQQVTATAQLVRTDSGISSSINNRRRSATPMSLDSMSLDSLDLDDPKFGMMETAEGNGHCTHQGSSSRRVVRTISSIKREKRSIRKKTILHRVNMYVNPGELVAIMGPSGSGKTTLLDVLLGRRRAGYTEGEILINGTPLHKIREWFIVNTGYVRQLAKSYYNELTVRENLIFSMSMQAQKGMKLSQKLERVEQVIQEMGLLEQADIKVGDGIGLGLSGGQRKRLAIAIQLLSMPNIIFLDEPTSGLDSASSLDILKSLQVMAGTGRAIVVTIHQPRSEIFHAFDKILLLCNGQIAFFGSPVKVWEFFRVALISEKELKESEGQVQDAVLDLLKEKRSQRQVLHAYKDSNEPKHVKQAVLDSKTDHPDFPHQTQSRNPGIWNRLVALESRASLRQTFFTIIYLPIVYLVLGLILGTTYLFTTIPVQVLSVTCLLSCSSSLFMSSIISSLLVEPLKLFYLEHSDGISKSHELILQVFIRMTALSTLPLSACSTIVFGLVYQNYTFETYLVVLLAFLLVNQVWISIFIVLNVLSPSQAHRLCPVFAAAGGFCCGFIVPKSLMPVYYRWIFYINPSFYAYSATGVTVLEGNEIECNRSSTLECFRDSGLATIEYFGLADVNPFQNLVILMSMLVILLCLGIFILQLKVNFGIIKDNLFHMFCISSKKRQRRKRKRVSSIENSADRPMAMLTSVVMRRDICQATPTSKADEAMLDGGMDDVDGITSRKAALKQLKRTRPSSQFLESGFHYLLQDFPWNQKEDLLLQDTDAIDGELQDEAPTLFSPASHRSRIVSDGSEDVFEPPLTEMMINMEEDQNEEARRIHANLKWNLRRQKIENEFWRLRHLSINRSRRAAAGGVARLRHSVSFGDDLEIQLEQSGMRELEKEVDSAAGNGDPMAEAAEADAQAQVRKRSRTTMTLGRQVNPNKPYGRSMSMPSKDFDEHLPSVDPGSTPPSRPRGGGKVPPSLETHKEACIEEEEEEEEDMLGLPPKDIPNISMEQLDWPETDDNGEESN